MRSATIFYNGAASDSFKPLFEKPLVLPLREIALFPAESMSYYTATIMFGVKKGATYVVVADVKKTGLSTHESVILAMLLKKLGVKHAFTVVVTGIFFCLASPKNFHRKRK